MKCPKCKAKDLQKIDGFDSPLSCRQCGGIWVEYDNIPKFMKSTDLLKGDQESSGLNDDRTGVCPSGHGVMIRAKIDIEEPFYLEKCGDCGGIWFDNGEWQKIINCNLVDSLNELWCKSWQVKQRKEKSRKNYLESNERLLGNEVFQEVMKLAGILKEHPEKGRAVALLQQEVVKNFD